MESKPKVVESDKDLSVSEWVEPKKDLPDVESILKHKGMRSIEWAMQEYGKAMVNHYKASLRKEIDSIIVALGKDQSAINNSQILGMKTIRALLDTITPQ